MSSDDFLAVLETKERTYTVQHLGTEGGLIEDVGTFKTLREALLRAQEYENEQPHGIEYGLKFYPFPRS